MNLYSSTGVHLEEGEAVASSSLVDEPVVASRKDDGSLDVNGSYGDGTSEEGSWFDEVEDRDRDLNIRKDEFYTLGYREGITEGQKDAAQEGFNSGFKDSVMVGYKWGIVKGVTSAFAHIPAELKAKLVEKDEIRRDFLNLHGDVDIIGKEDALKLFYEDVNRLKSAEQSRSVDSGSSLTHLNGSGDLENYSRKLELLLQESPALNVHLK